MTSSESKDQLPGAEQVSRAYRAANFDEVPPAAVDRAILAAARQERRRPLASYLPPLALAATVVLSVSLILRSGVLNENTEIFSSEPEIEPPARPAIELRARQAQPELTEEIAQDQQAIESLAIESTAATAGAANFAQTGCTDADREEPISWLECIAATLTNGDENNAREELAAFVEVHPDYVLPAELEATLTP